MTKIDSETLAIIEQMKTELKGVKMHLLDATDKVEELNERLSDFQSFARLVFVLVFVIVLITLWFST